MLSRRTFLRHTALSAGLLTLSRLRVPALAASVTAGSGLQVLTVREADILTAIVERMVDAGGAAMPAVRDTGAIATIDQALLQLDPALQSQFRWLLAVFQWSPPLLQLSFTTFTNMSPAAGDAYLRGWSESRFATRRLAFRALKNLSMLGYYSQDDTWKGIHYDGPWAPRPRRALGVG